jgi:hypothetical protein
MDFQFQSNFKFYFSINVKFYNNAPARHRAPGERGARGG